MPRLRAVNIEVQVCSCGAHYQSGRCPVEACRQPFDATRMRRITRYRLIVVADEVLHYHRVVRYNCSQRAEHYRRIHGLPAEAPVPAGVLRSEEWLNLCEPPADGATPVHCPLCGQPVKPTPSRVWQRRFPSMRSLAENDFDHRHLLTDDPAPEADEEKQP